jgi:thiol-disulfide isomerase/thioredoxin
MVRNYLLIISFGFIFSILGINCQSNSAPTPANSEIPSIEILLTDSSTIFHTNTLSARKPVVLLFFSSNCDHCQKEAEDLVHHKETLKKIKLVMISTEELYVIRNFYEQYGLSAVNKLIIGKDIRYAGIKHFQFESIPYCAFYSKGHKYLGSLERNFNTNSIILKLKEKGEL